MKDGQEKSCFLGIICSAGEFFAARRRNLCTGVHAQLSHLDGFIEDAIQDYQMLFYAAGRLSRGFFVVYIALNDTRRYITKPQFFRLKIRLYVVVVIARISLICVLPQTPLFSRQPFIYRCNQRLLIGNADIITQLIDPARQHLGCFQLVVFCLALIFALCLNLGRFGFLEISAILLGNSNHHIICGISDLQAARNTHETSFVLGQLLTPRLL